MSIFTKRREEEEEMPRPSESPSHMTAHPGQPHRKLGALSSPPTDRCYGFSANYDVI